MRGTMIEGKDLKQLLEGAPEGALELIGNTLARFLSKLEEEGE
jgi:hypothetical protein